jgi:hypothetical protein
MSRSILQVRFTSGFVARPHSECKGLAWKKGIHASLKGTGKPPACFYHAVNGYSSAMITCACAQIPNSPTQMIIRRTPLRALTCRRARRSRRTWP